MWRWQAAADQGEVVDVGGSACGGVPGDGVVGFAVLWCCAAEDAASVAGDEGVPLGWGGGPYSAALPEDFALPGEDGADEVGVAPEPFQFGGR